MAPKDACPQAIVEEVQGGRQDRQAPVSGILLFVRSMSLGPAIEREIAVVQVEFGVSCADTSGRGSILDVNRLDRILIIERKERIGLQPKLIGTSR